MTKHRSSTGDPARTLELLWREPLAGRARGPKQTLSIDSIVAVATELADVEGIDAVTMRSLAKRLGVVPMALYTYVPGKAELIDLMLDAAYAAMERSAPRDDGWRARLEAVARDNRALYARHPWVAGISTSRPPLGPGMMAKYEHELRALEHTGLGDVEMDAALTFVLGFVDSCAQAAADVRAIHSESHTSDAEWWSANAPLLARVFDAAKYPTAARVGSAAGEAHGAAYDPAHAFEFGLARVLDGLGVLIAERTPRGRRSR